MNKLLAISIFSILFSVNHTFAKCNDPVWGSDGSEPDEEIIQVEIKKVSKSSGQRALEEQPFNPTLKKGNGPVWGSDGSDPEPELIKEQ